MTALDYVTALEAGIAALALACRGNMLKPEAKGWVTSRAASMILMGLSIVFAAVAMDVFKRGGASMREAVAYSALAIASVLMFLHLARQHKGPEVSE